MKIFMKIILYSYGIEFRIGRRCWKVMFLGRKSYSFVMSVWMSFWMSWCLSFHREFVLPLIFILFCYNFVPQLQVSSARSHIIFTVSSPIKNLMRYNKNTFFKTDKQHDKTNNSLKTFEKRLLKHVIFSLILAHFFGHNLALFAYIVTHLNFFLDNI